MKKSVLVVACCLFACLCFSADTETGSLLLYADTKGIPADMFSGDAKSAIEFTFFFADGKQPIRKTASKEFSLHKNMAPGTYTVEKIGIYNRTSGKRKELPVTNVSFDVGEGSIAIFPLKIYAGKVDDGAVVKSYTTEIRGLTDEDRQRCQEYIDKKVSR